MWPHLPQFIRVARAGWGGSGKGALGDEAHGAAGVLNMLGGITFTGLTLYTTHLKTAPKRVFEDVPGQDSTDTPHVGRRLAS
jgi:hypothetical protein